MASYDSPIRANVKVHPGYDQYGKPHSGVYWYDDEEEVVVRTDMVPVMGQHGQQAIGPDGQPAMRATHVTERRPRRRLKIDYGPGTDSHLGKISAFWDDIKPEVTPRGSRSRIDDPHSAIGTMKRVSIEALQPYVDAFLANQEVSIYGTPLSDWAEIDRQRLNVFHQFGLRTIEQVLNAPESVMIKIAPSMPDVRRWQEKGAKYLKAKEQNITEAQLAARDTEITDLKSQLEEMRQMMSQLIGNKIAEQGEATAPRRGRPPKVQAEQAPDEVAA